MRFVVLVALCMAHVACAGESSVVRYEPIQPKDRLELVWIDTDPVSRPNQTADIDDVLAVRMVTNAHIPVRGLSTVDGNGSAVVTWQSARLEFRSLSLHRGRPKAGCNNPAVAALLRELRRGPLTVLALGPLTNIAQAISCDRKATEQIERIVAVAGRQPGEVFRLGSGLWPRALRDLNYETDREAFQTVLRSGIELHLVPFAAGNRVRLSYGDLHRLPEHLRERSWSWMLILWFAGGGATLPAFDQTAASYLIWPHLFECRGVSIEAGGDLVVHLRSGRGGHPHRLCLPPHPDRLKRAMRRFLR